MAVPRLFLFMFLASVSPTFADDAPVSHAPGAQVPSTVGSDSPTVSKDTSPESVTKRVTKKKRAAKKKKKKEPLPEKPVITEVTVPMAKGELQAEVAAEQAQRERANAPRTEAEIGVSSWKPNRATTYSRIAGTSDFSTKGIPSIDATLFAPIASRRDLHVEGGVGFLALHRTAVLTGTGLNIPQDENGYVLTFRLGVTFSPWTLMSDRMVPYVAAAAIPSFLITRESSFDGGQSDFGVPFELGLGAIFSVYKNLGLDVGVTETLGSVKDSDFKGFAVRGGLRMQL